MTTTPPGNRQGSLFDRPDPPLWAPHYACPPGTAVRRFFRKYADFTGRASRSEYWWWQLMSLLGTLVLCLLVFLAGIPGADSTGPGPGQIVGIGVVTVCLLAIVVPSFALTVRRLHDANLSGLLVVCGLIPYVGSLILIVLALLPTHPDGERFDDPQYRITREGYSKTRTPSDGQRRSLPRR